MNAKNQLQEMLASLGHNPDQHIAFVNVQHPTTLQWESCLRVCVVGFPELAATGSAARKTDAEIRAAESILPLLPPEFRPDWPRALRDAQAGDALIKLAAYRAEELGSTADASEWLQLYESDAALARVFDRWSETGVEELRGYGPALGTKQKATLVEAVVWRRYGPRVLRPEAEGQLAELGRLLVPPGTP